jgi:hypothetical protein
MNLNPALVHIFVPAVAPGSSRGRPRQFVARCTHFLNRSVILGTYSEHQTGYEAVSWGRKSRWVTGAPLARDDGDLSLRRGNESATKLSASAWRALSIEQRGGTEGARVRVISSGTT